MPERLMWAAAVSQIDGGDGDGVHLLFGPARGAGHSLTGFDIQRRPHRSNGKRSCRTLEPGELTRLELDLHLRTGLALVTRREAACLVGPTEPLQTPYAPRDGESAELSFEGPSGVVANPLWIDDVRVALLEKGVPAEQARVLEAKGAAYLELGEEAVVELPADVSWARVALAGEATMHVSGLTLEGVQVAEQKAAGGEAPFLQGPLRSILVRRLTDEPAWLAGLEFAYAPADVKTAEDEEASPSHAPAAWWRWQGSNPTHMAGHEPEHGACAAYGIDFGRPMTAVRVACGAPMATFIGLREGEAIVARAVADASEQVVEFRDLIVDRVEVYLAEPVSSLSFCGTPAAHAAADDLWEDVPYLVRNLQLPVRSADPALGSEAEEIELARSRLLAGEWLDEGLQELLQTVGDAVAAAGEAPSSRVRMLVREREKDPFVELAPLDLALAAASDPRGRRALGFGFLDRGYDLVEGDAYDYRVSGTFRAPAGERFLGFQAVPAGTALPSAFALGPLHLHTREPAQVRLADPPADEALRHFTHKGLALDMDAGAVEIAFDRPRASVTLAFAPRWGERFVWSTTFPSLLASEMSGEAEATWRVTLDFAAPVPGVRIEGGSFFLGVHLSEDGASAAPEERQSVVIANVRYEPTAPPPPPAFIGAVGLQAASPPGEAVAPDPRNMHQLGFRVSWLPPGGPPLWPPDLPASPPVDAIGYALERRRVDATGPEADFQAPADRPVVTGSRGGRGEIAPLAEGADLLACFPEERLPVPPVSVVQEIEDVLVDLKHTGPPPGSLHQYRAYSVDVLGRRSASAAVSRVARLEKHRPPPMPVGPGPHEPAGVPPDPDRQPAPMGVRARAIVAGDPALTEADARLLDGRDDAIVVEWGYRPEEREQDPHAVEFRVYLHAAPPDEVELTLTGAPRRDGGGFAMSAMSDRPVREGELAGQYVTHDGAAFRMTGHGGGSAFEAQLAPPRARPAAVPGPGSWRLTRAVPVLQSPLAGWERVAVRPLDGGDRWSAVLRDRLGVGPLRPSVRVWVGVSAADAQSYVADALAAPAPLAGRRGNESRIAVVAVVARHRARPQLSAPPSRAAVPERLTAEPVAGAARVSLDLGRLAAGVAVGPGAAMRVERLAASAVLGRVRRAGDGAQVERPDGPRSWSPVNPADRQAFVAQLRGGRAAAVESRFVRALLLDEPAAFEKDWAAVGDVAPGSVVADTLPPNPERYVYRVRAITPGGLASETAALLPEVVRVPALDPPGVPAVLAFCAAHRDRVAVRATLDAPAGARLLLFADALPLPARAQRREWQGVTLLRRPNAGADGAAALRVRLGDGRLLAPVATLPVAPDRDSRRTVVEHALTIGYERQVAVFAVVVSRDGIPSGLVGPQATATGLAPPAVPPLRVVAPASGATYEDRLECDPAATGLELAVERAEGAGWRRVSPWRSHSTTTFDVARATGPRRYRLLVRDAAGDVVAGAPVEAP